MWVRLLDLKNGFLFRNTNKQKGNRNNNICRFCEKNNDSDKVRDHCHLTGEYGSPAHQKKTNVTENQSNFIPFVFRNFSNCDCHLFFTKLIDKENDKVKFAIIPKTNEDCISVTYGCIR